MAERRMLLNSTESFIGTMYIDYEYQNSDKQLNLNLNNDIKIIEQNHDNSGGHYIIGLKNLIIPEGFVIENYNNRLELQIASDYNIAFLYNCISHCHIIDLQGNFDFIYKSIYSAFINLFDFNYIYNKSCFGNSSYINFNGKYIRQCYEKEQNQKIYGYSHIIYDLMKYNNVEESDEETQNYRILYNIYLIISSPTEYITTKPKVDLGNNNYINSVNTYMYNGNYITEYHCPTDIIHLRKGITLPQNATVYIPDTVIDIDNNTFTGESNLKKIIIFGNCKLTYLDGFYNSSLENIEIYSDKIETIKEYCFANSHLKTINIPKSVKYIEGMAFDHLDNGLVINYKGTIEDWNNINLEDFWYGQTTGIIIHCTNGDIQL